MIGTIKAIFHPFISAIKAKNGGINAPPEMQVQSKPEAFGLKSPKPSIAIVKIVGNMIELNSPIASAVHILSNPPV